MSAGSATAWCTCATAPRHEQTAAPTSPLAVGGALSLSVIPELQLCQIVRYCERRVPEHARDQVQVSSTVRGQRATIVKLRPPWRADVSSECTSRPIAQLRWTPPPQETGQEGPGGCTGRTGTTAGARCLTLVGMITDVTDSDQLRSPNVGQIQFSRAVDRYLHRASARQSTRPATARERACTRPDRRIVGLR
jgi:hypothetical protein